MKKKVLLDTDIGTDIDDAVCLAYLLAHPDCELLGITTVTGEAKQRAMLASAICQHAERDVPIYPGAELPLMVPLKQKEAQQAVKLGHWDHRTDFPRGEAVEFLRRTIRNHPGEVTLLTVAPLTNAGLLFSVDPEIPGMLGELVMMCGMFLAPAPDGYGPLEWNAIGDPHATSIVYRSGVRRHRSVGIDVTHRVSQSRDEFRTRYAGVKLMEPVLDFAEVWFRDWPGTTFHDPLAAAVIFSEDLCRFERGTVSVETSHGEFAGKTSWQRSEGGHHEIAVSVQAEAFFRHFDDIIRRTQ